MKKILVTLVLAGTLIGFVSAQTVTPSDFNSALDDFLGEINTATPDNAVIGGTWSDAYIGQIVGIPPHFGVGVAMGVTRFPIEGFKDALTLTKTDIPVDTLILPNIGGEIRVGGFLLPFDFGIRGFMMPDTDVGGVTAGYTHFGVDVRYAVIKGNLVLPSVSVGLGYYHTDGSLAFPLTAGDLFGDAVPDAAAGEELDLGLEFGTNVFEVKAQVSKGLIFITPYAGLGLSMALSESSYDVGGYVTNTVSETVYGARVYGGFSFNILVLKLDLTGSYNVLSQNWGVNFGTRIQL